MPPRVSVKVERLETMRRDLRRLPKDIAPAAKEGLWRAILGLRKDFQAQLALEGFRKPRLKWIWRPIAFGNPDDLSELGARLYPRDFHQSFERFEKGTTDTTPRRAQRFAIPLPRVRKRGGRGAPRVGYSSPRAFRARWPRNRKLVALRSKGKLYLIEYRKKRGRWESIGPAFLIVDKVRTPKRLGMQRYWGRRQVREKFLARVNSRIVPAMRKRFGNGVKGGRTA